jgi:hypothetical protein
MSLSVTTNLFPTLLSSLVYLIKKIGRESDITKERIEKILKSGANVVFTTKGIDDMSLKVCFYNPSRSGSRSFLFDFHIVMLHSSTDYLCILLNCYTLILNGTLLSCR